MDKLDQMFDLFRRTTFFVDGPAGQFGIRVGQVSGAADDLLHRHGA